MSHNPAISAALNQALTEKADDATTRANKAEAELAKRDAAEHKAARQREADKKRRAKNYERINAIVRNAFGANGKATVEQLSAATGLSVTQITALAKMTGAIADPPSPAEIAAQVSQAAAKARGDDPDAPEDDNSDVGDHIPDDPKKKKTKKKGKENESDDDKRDDDSVKSRANVILSNWQDRAARKDEEQKVKSKLIADLVVAAGDKRRGR